MESSCRSGVSSITGRRDHPKNQTAPDQAHAEHIADQGDVSVAILTENAWLRIDGRERPVDFSSMAERVLVEHAVLGSASVPHVTILSR